MVCIFVLVNPDTFDLMGVAHSKVVSNPMCRLVTLGIIPGVSIPIESPGTKLELGVRCITRAVCTEIRPPQCGSVYSNPFPISGGLNLCI